MTTSVKKYNALLRLKNDKTVVTSAYLLPLQLRGSNKHNLVPVLYKIGRPGLYCAAGQTAALDSSLVTSRSGTSSMKEMGSR